MVRPIRTLDEGARRIGAGELDQKIDIRTGDELEGLADQFNRMSAQLRESYAGLERKVDERTRELTNSLEQQTAISEILRVISARRPTCSRCSRPWPSAPRTCATRRSRAWCWSRATSCIRRLRTRIRSGPGYDDPVEMKGPFPLKRSYVIGRAALDRETVHVADILPLLDTEYPDAQADAAAVRVSRDPRGAADARRRRVRRDPALAPRAAGCSRPTRSRCCRPSRARRRSPSTTCACSTRRRRRSSSRRRSARSCA